jgi:aldose 1-epimerase
VQDKDLEQGYPGNFCCSVTYILNEENELKLHYEAECDQDTVCNLTNHTYFNLGGQESGSILNTQLWLAAKEYTPVIDGQAIPTGEYAPVAGTVFDFTQPKTIGRDIEADEPQLKYVGGYDHNFVIQREQGIDQRFAEAYNPETGICLEAFTDLPGFQFYSGNFMKDEKGKKGAQYTKRCGFCLETQFYPNSINQEGFAKPILKAGSKFASTTTYRFTVR